MPEVSIVVPVYCVEKYLRECLDSILNQTYKNYELLLVDDGSTDKSGQICDEYAQMYNNIHVIHQHNQGQAAARYNGVKAAKADWIMFVDSDDVVHPNLLEYVYKSIKDSNSLIGVCSRIKSHNIPEDFWNEQTYSFDINIITENQLEEYYDTNNSIYWALFPSIIKKEIVINRPFVNGRIYEDNAISCQWLNDAGQISIIPNVLYWYRDNPEGTMNKPLTLKKLDYLWALEEQVKFYDSVSYYKMRNKISIDYLNTAIYFYNKCNESVDEHRIKRFIRKETKKFLMNHLSYIDIPDDLYSRLNKILHPRVFKFKKHLKAIYHK